jgi:hypothetical protein
VIRRIAIRIATSLFLAGAAAAIACIDMSAPKGPASISLLLLPSPSVVVGDTMRDSTGAAAPLRVIAYDANNNPLPNVSTQFFLTDSAAAGHLVNNNTVVGDKQGAMHIIGQIAGLQTSAAAVPVTVAPTSFALAAPLSDTFFVPFAGDTTAASTGTAPIGVSLKGVGDTASLGFLVKYELSHGPATVAGSTIPGIFFADDAGNPSGVDTTDATGASRRLVVRAWLLADPAVKAGQQVDSAVVLVTTSYKGKPVSGSPIRVVLPIKVRLAIQ